MVVVRRYSHDLEPGMMIRNQSREDFRIGGVTTEGERIGVMAVNMTTGQFAEFDFDRHEFVKTVETDQPASIVIR